jgi:hypothetical protein
MVFSCGSLPLPHSPSLPPALSLNTNQHFYYSKDTDSRFTATLAMARANFSSLSHSVTPDAMRAFDSMRRSDDSVTMEGGDGRVIQEESGWDKQSRKLSLLYLNSSPSHSLPTSLPSPSPSFSLSLSPSPSPSSTETLSTSPTSSAPTPSEESHSDPSTSEPRVALMDEILLTQRGDLVIATHPHDPTTQGVLRLREGDVIEIVDNLSHEDWWYGRRWSTHKPSSSSSSSAYNLFSSLFSLPSLFPSLFPSPSSSSHPPLSPVEEGYFPRSHVATLSQYVTSHSSPEDTAENGKGHSTSLSAISEVASEFASPMKTVTQRNAEISIFNLSDDNSEITRNHFVALAEFLIHKCHFHPVVRADIVQRVLHGEIPYFFSSHFVDSNLHTVEYELKEIRFVPGGHPLVNELIDIDPFDSPKYPVELLSEAEKKIFSDGVTERVLKKVSDNLSGHPLPAQMAKDLAAYFNEHGKSFPFGAFDCYLAGWENVWIRGNSSALTPQMLLSDFPQLFPSFIVKSLLPYFEEHSSIVPFLRLLCRWPIQKKVVLDCLEGIFWENRREYLLALSLYLQALEENPHLTQIVIRTGWCFLGLGHPSIAWKFFDLARRMESSSADVKLLDKIDESLSSSNPLLFGHLSSNLQAWDHVE